MCTQPSRVTNGHIKPTSAEQSLNSTGEIDPTAHASRVTQRRQKVCFPSYKVYSDVND